MHSNIVPPLKWVGMFNKILVVNDNDILLFTAKKMLTKANCTKDIVTAINGQIALDYLQSITDQNADAFPDLIILDLHMPIVDGWEFMEQYDTIFANSQPQTKIVILSASINPEDIEQIQQYSFVLGDIINGINLSIIENIQQRYRQAVAMGNNQHMVA